MKSKISFFNKTVFWKNVTLYWPIWTVYTLTLLFALPFMVWVNYADSLRNGVLTDVEKIECISYTLWIEPYVWIISIMAVVTGMAVYSYLYNSKSANMIHSLPVDRSQLYGTNVITGVAFLTIPQILTFFVTMFICLNYEMTNIEYLAQWLLICLGIDIVAFGIVTFCAFFTGQLVTMPVYAIIINCLSFVFLGIIDVIVGSFAYGVNGAGFINYELAKWFSPIYAIGIDVSMDPYYDKFGNLTGIEVTGAWELLIYVVVAVGLVIAAYFVYQKRNIEQAGDLITVGWVKPIFRWGVGFCGGFLCSIYVTAVLDGLGMPILPLVFIILSIICGIIFYFVADMFVQKSFRVFGKKCWKNCGIFVISLLVSYAALYGYAKYEENLIPDVDDIEYATIEYGYTSKFKGEEAQKVIDMHKEILAHKDIFRNASYNWDVERISVSYMLESGRYISRYYLIPVEQYDGDLFVRLREMEMEADNFLRNTFDENYTEIKEFGNGLLSFTDDNYDYQEFQLSKEVSKKVFDAIIADAKKGTLQPYNAYYGYYYDEYYYEDNYENDVMIESVDDGSVAHVCLYYYAPDDLAERIFNEVRMEDRYWYENYSSWYYDEITGNEYYYTIIGNKVQIEANMSFGSNCTNIIKALIDGGVIESVDVLGWE